MTEMDIAILVIRAASVADGGCHYCAEEVLAYAMRARPELPWGMAAEGLASENKAFKFAVKVVNGGNGQ